MYFCWIIVFIHWHITRSRKRRRRQIQPSSSGYSLIHGQITDQAMVLAAEAGHLTHVQRLLPTSTPTAQYDALCGAIRGGHTQIVALLLWVTGEVVTPHALMPELIQSLENGHPTLVTDLVDQPVFADVLGYRCNALLQTATRLGNQSLMRKCHTAKHRRRATLYETRQKKRIRA